MRQNPKATAEQEYLIEELAIKIPKSWLVFMLFCMSNVPNGKVGFEMAKGHPTELDTEYTTKRTRFDSPDEPLPTVAITDFGATKLAIKK